MDERLRMAVMPDKDCSSGLDIPGIMIVVRECFTVACMQEPGTREDCMQPCMFNVGMAGGYATWPIKLEVKVCSCQR